MLTQIFLGVSQVGAEAVLILLIGLSVLSVSLIVERWRFYRQATRGLVDLQGEIRRAAEQKNWPEMNKALETHRIRFTGASAPESAVAQAICSQNSRNSEVLGEVAQDAVIRSRLEWEKNLAVLATIGSNAPFIGLFGTVLGIIKAFHDLSNQASTGVQAVTAGISEALIATAIGILVAIPAVVAFNLFQRRVKQAVSQAEALKSFLIGKMAD
jgi:biopolymer transport protein ExbB